MLDRKMREHGQVSDPKGGSKYIFKHLWVHFVQIENNVKIESLISYDLYFPLRPFTMHDPYVGNVSPSHTG